MLTFGVAPLTGRTSSAEHRIHRAISNCGFCLCGGSVESAEESWGEDAAVFRVVAR